MDPKYGTIIMTMPNSTSLNTAVIYGSARWGHGKGTPFDLFCLIELSLYVGYCLVLESEITA